MEVRNIDVQKLTLNEQAAIVKKYKEAGWQLNGQWELSIHQWLSFTWPKDEEPPEM